MQKKKFKVTPSKPNDQLNYLPNSVGCDKIIDAGFSKEIQKPNKQNKHKKSNKKIECKNSLCPIPQAPPKSKLQV